MCGYIMMYGVAQSVITYCRLQPSLLCRPWLQVGRTKSGTEQHETQVTGNIAKRICHTVQPVARGQYVARDKLLNSPPRHLKWKRKIFITATLNKADLERRDNFENLLYVNLRRHYLFTSLSTVLLENLTGFQLVKKFPTFYGTQKFITAFTNAHHLSLSSGRSIQSITPHPTYWKSILILSSHLRLGLPSGLFPSVFPTKTCVHLFSPSYALHTIYFK